MYLFDRQRTHKQGEWQTREREKQAPRWAGSLMWGSIPGPWAEGRRLTDGVTQASQVLTIFKCSVQ